MFKFTVRDIEITLFQKREGEFTLLRVRQLGVVPQTRKGEINYVPCVIDIDKEKTTKAVNDALAGTSDDFAQRIAHAKAMRTLRSQTQSV